jgi:hypothetical protein
LRQTLLDGKKRVDFGTSPKSQVDLIAYKEKWGGRTFECPHSMLEPEDKKGIPRVIRLDRESKSMTAASHIIRYMPLRIFRFISPFLLRLAS